MWKRVIPYLYDTFEVGYWKTCGNCKGAKAGVGNVELCLPKEGGVCKTMTLY